MSIETSSWGSPDPDKQIRTSADYELLDDPVPTLQETFGSLKGLPEQLWLGIHATGIALRGTLRYCMAKMHDTEPEETVYEYTRRRAHEERLSDTYQQVDA